MLAQLVGNCVSCFDGDICTENQLPWNNTDAFAAALLDDGVEELNEHEFRCSCDYKTSQDATEFLKIGNVYIAYNENIHKYFFYVGS